MRVDSWELPLSAIPFCQLLPCHFGPPRPMLSINLYVKGCLDYHWSIAHVHTIGVFSPSEWGPEPQCQAAQVAHWTWWWQCLVAWHCRSVWSLPCHFAANAGGSALSKAKSHWHVALPSAHKSCTHGHVFWKRGGVKRGLVADLWTSSRRFSHVLWFKVHSHLLLRACLLGSKRKLPPQACQVWPGLPSVICHPRGVQFPGTMYLCSQGPFSSAWAHCISSAPSACSHCRSCCCCPLQCDKTAHGNSPELCRRSSPVLQIMIFVIPAFTLSPFFSIASFQVKSLLTHSSSDSAMITRSSA